MSSLALEIRPDEIRAPARPPPRLGTSVAEWREHRRASLKLMPPVALFVQPKPCHVAAKFSVIPENPPEIPRPSVIDSLFIIKLCSNEFGVSVRDVRYGGRKRCLVRPRQVAMHLCKTRLGRSLSAIGRKFGGKDHTTVLYAVRSVPNLIATDPILAAHVAEIEKKITRTSEGAR